MMHRKLIVLIITFWLLSGCSFHVPAEDCKKMQDLVIRFPNIHLSEKERVVSFQVRLGGYWVTGVRNLPLDWGLTYDPATPTEVKLKAAAGHGAGALGYGENLRIEISIHEMPSYESATLQRGIEATVYTTEDFDHTKEYRYGRNELVKE